MTKHPIALVLAGGGITGAVYEVGALRAINTLLVGRTVNDFDIYVGTSAGALVSALLCNNLTPHEILQTLDDRHPELRSFNVSDLFQLELGSILRRLYKLPRSLYHIGQNAVQQGRNLAISDLLWELADVLPGGLYSGAAFEQYVRTILESPGRTNRFTALTQALYIVATDLDAGARAVFSRHATEAPLISQAVAASSAVPILYQPVQIQERDYLDGGLQGAASLDLAIEAGAKLVVCINPMTPLDANQHYPGQHYIRNGGFQAIINQTVRVLLHANVSYHVKNLRLKYPDVDIILIQPARDDYAMFAYNPMHYRSRLAVAEHGFRTVTQGLLANFAYFQRVLGRHGIKLNAEPLHDNGQNFSLEGETKIAPKQRATRSWSHPALTELNVNLNALEALVAQQP